MTRHGHILSGKKAFMRPRRRSVAVGLVLMLATTLLVGAKPGGSTVPPGRQYVLTIGGENAITFVPQANVPPVKVDYKARVEYVVNTRSGEEVEKAVASAKKKTTKKASSKAKAKAKEAEDEEEPKPKVAGQVDISVHSSEIRFRQNEQMVMESRSSRARFQGRFQPDGPMLNVSYNDAPPPLKEHLKRLDTPVASILLDENSKVVARRVLPDGPLHALTETLLSIHTPIPKDAAFWEAPTQLAMGHGQTAKGTLRFEKVKESLAKSGGLVNVKVSGVLKAEGVVVGRLIKDGSYTVAGEQSYDPKSREWKSARWSVEVNNELANPGGTTVAHAKGTMTVQSKALAEPSPSTSEEAPKEGERKN
jgi:hypothetical protein